MMYRKLIPLGAACALAGTLLAPAGARAAIKLVPSFSAASVPLHGKAFNVQVATRSSFEFTTIDVAQGTAHLVGEVRSQGGLSTAFDLSGPLLRTRSGNVVGQLSDADHNFGVLKFAIDSAPQNDAFLTGVRPMPGTTVISLYLTRGSSRDVDYFDALGLILIPGSVYARGTSAGATLPLANNALTLWFERFFEPDTFARKNSAITRRSVHHDTVTYTDLNWTSWYDTTYDVAFHTYDDYVQVNQDVNAPSGITGTTSVFCNLSIQSEYIDVSGGSVIQNTTGWRVGYAGPAGCKLVTTRPAGIAGVDNGGYGISGGGANFSVSLSASIAAPGVPISFDGILTYDTGSSQALGSYVQANPSNRTTMTSYLPSGTYLQSVGDHWNSRWDLVHVSGYSSASTKIDCGFVYNLHNVGPDQNNNGNPEPYTNPQVQAVGWYANVN